MSECLPIENLPPYIPWVYSIFGSCVYGYRDAFSTFFGYFSIFCWLSAHIPQMIENYQLKSADGLSIYLLLFWFASDSGTLLGCFLNHQMFSQILLNCIFIACDITLIFQYFYYKRFADSKYSSALENSKLSEEESNGPHYGSISKKTKSATTLMGLMLFGMPFTSEMTTGGSSLNNPITFGLMLAWTCVSLDITSRFPQLYKNYKRHSVEGLSVALFTWALGGNLSYGLSVALHPGRTGIEFAEAFPYILGSLVTFSLDLLLFAQHIYYTRKNKPQTSFV